MNIGNNTVDGINKGRFKKVNDGLKGCGKNEYLDRKW